ncbi:Uma2 family endonuclease [Nodosilinea sp. LEGE 07088]|uniref:Uma2 family endonuclease n=1 Tax=Nodosilinea sp. LEGE 07088 TaxID=2777968 RepID=UPI0028BDAD40|nr:Uma2 family endonuclease [Nodosilinea sp. LEGE 07088]
MEAVSASTKSTDYRAKRAEYSVLDSPEYWICGPLKEKLTGCALLEGWYEAAEYIQESTIKSLTFSSLKLIARDIW